MVTAANRLAGGALLQDLQTGYRLFHAGILTEVGVQKQGQIPAAEELLGERGVAVPTLCWWKV